LSVFRPSGLPPSCQSQTLVASADTFVQSAQPTTPSGSATTLSVNGRSSSLARALVSFTLPAMPGCTLSSATLRIYNGTPTAGRTIAVYRAAGAWTEATTWNTAPATTGTAVTAAAATGTMQWNVTAQVQAQYAGTNNGFIVRDNTETQNGQSPQTFSSRENAANKPELVLTWA